VIKLLNVTVFLPYVYLEPQLGFGGVLIGISPSCFASELESLIYREVLCLCNDNDCGILHMPLKHAYYLKSSRIDKYLTFIRRMIQYSTILLY